MLVLLFRSKGAQHLPIRARNGQQSACLLGARANGCRDGSGITMLRRTGLVVGVISGRRSKANQFRAAELKLDFLVEECWNKALSLENIASERGLSTGECLFLPPRRCIPPSRTF